MIRQEHDSRVLKKLLLGSWRYLVGRGLDNEPEEIILKLLRQRYTVDDHDGLYKRRNELAKWFELVSPERSARLHGRLIKRDNGDELSRLFWKLATATRQQMLNILKKKIEHHRTTQTQRPQSATNTSSLTIAQSLKTRYIDNIFQRFVAPALDGYYVEWEENGNTYTFNLPEREIRRKRARLPTELFEIYPNKRAALQGIRDVHKNTSLPVPTKPPYPTIYTFYHGPNNIILPTIFTPDSTPKILDAIEEADRRLGRAVDEDLEAGRAITQSFSNYFNPLPMTEVNESGDLEISSNPKDLLMTQRGKIRRPRRMRKKPKYRMGLANLKRRLNIISNRYKFLGTKRWIKGKHTAAGYEEGFNAIVPKMARDLSDKRVRVDVPGNIGYTSPSTPTTNRLKLQKTRRGDILKRNPDATMEVVERGQKGTNIVKEVHFFEATTQNNFEAFIGKVGHKQRQISGTLWISSEIPRKGYSKKTRFHYHIVAPEKPTDTTIGFLYDVLDEIPNLHIEWLVVN